MSEPVTHSSYVSIDGIPPGVDFVAEVRSLNDAGVRIPWAWFLTVESVSLSPVPVGAVEPVMLTFGVHNEVGALWWFDGTEDHVPVGGLNADWRSYYSAGAHETAIPPRAEVPVATVYEAVAEFLATRDRPTCVEWEVSAPVASMFGGAEPS